MSEFLRWLTANLDYVAGGVFILCLLSFFSTILQIRSKAKMIRAKVTDSVRPPDRPAFENASGSQAVMLGESAAALRLLTGSEGSLSPLCIPAPQSLIMMGTIRGFQPKTQVIIESDLAAVEEMSWPFLPSGQSGRILNVPRSRQKNMACYSAK